MKILHWMKKENSGLARTTLELAIYEEKAGHQVSVRQPEQNALLYGTPGPSDIHSIHSQRNISTYHDQIPKVMWMHGEPLSSVGNGVSMKAIIDLAPMCDAFICMRKEEIPIWSSIKRTFLVPKGIDLEMYKPLSNVERLSEGDQGVPKKKQEVRSKKQEARSKEQGARRLVGATCLLSDSDNRPWALLAPWFLLLSIVNGPSWLLASDYTVPPRSTSC